MWGLLKSSLSYASQLSGASIVVFDFSIPPTPSSSAIIGLGGGGGEERWHLLDHRLCFPFWEPSFTFGGPKSLMAITSQFVDMARGISFHRRIGKTEAGQHL